MDKHKINLLASPKTCVPKAPPWKRAKILLHYDPPILRPNHDKPWDFTTTSEVVTKIKEVLENFDEPNYKDWLARKKWTIFEASCLFNEIEPFAFTKMGIIFPKNGKSVHKEMLVGSTVDVIDEILLFMSKIRKEAEIMLTWLPKYIRGKLSNIVTETGTEAEEDPLKLINTYLLTIGNVPQKLLTHAKKSFLLMYQSREATEETRKNWKENWHIIAPPFKTLINNSAKTKNELSPRKEETLLALIGILTDKYFIGTKYKKDNGLHRTSIIAEDIIGYISKQFPDNQTPHGFKKSNLIEIINNSLDCWKKKKEV